MGSLNERISTSRQPLRDSCIASKYEKDGVALFSFDPLRGIVKEEKTVTLDQWPDCNGDWNADGSGLLIPSFIPAGTPVILEVNKAGKASVVLEGAVHTPFEFMLEPRTAVMGFLER